MIPLYALGVFISFTLSQTSMTLKHLRDREPGWRSGVLINGFGAVTTGIVDVVIALTKFREGAWMVMVAIPVGVLILVHLNKTYERERGDLHVGIDQMAEPARPKHEIVILVEKMDASVAHALRYAKQISPFGLHSRVTALHAELDAETADELQTAWERFNVPIPLRRVDCPDRNIPGSIVEWIDRHRSADTEITVLIPQRGYTRWWHRLVHDRTSSAITRALRRYRDVNAILVPFYLKGGKVRITAAEEAGDVPAER
jgi:hypothetical protein